jgi:hypothetical protein
MLTVEHRVMLTHEPQGDMSAASTTWLECQKLVHRLANILRGQVFRLWRLRSTHAFAKGKRENAKETP